MRPALLLHEMPRRRRRLNWPIVGLVATWAVIALALYACWPR